MKSQKFGIEIEMTGITRQKASKIIAEYYDSHNYTGSYAIDNKGREWKLVYDGSILKQIKNNGRRIRTDDSSYSVELVSPICKYDDIEDIQEIVRKLRKSGALVNSSTGIHIHINAEPYNAKTLKNLINIVRSKEDILYKALNVGYSRETNFCKKVNEKFIQDINKKKPKNKEELKMLWYEGNDGSYRRYHHSRYRGLNLHSLFEKGTVEFRLFNGSLHAGKIKSYIQLCLAISNQALTQKSARFTRTVSTNEKYTFRTWLLRLGMIGKEFKTARLHLLKNLEGNIAWKNPEDAIRQREVIQEDNDIGMSMNSM